MSSSLFDLTGKTIVVTGGSRGIGLMMAEGFLRSGASVIISSRKQEACDQAVNSLSPLGSISAVVADLSIESECIRLAEAVAAKHEGVDVLVNNAGATWGEPFETFPASAWDKVIDINLKAPFLLSRAMLPLLTVYATAETPSRIINIGSIDALQVPMHSNYSYSTSKAAVHHLTRVLARELAPQHVLVNAVAPGPFETKMMSALLDESRSRIEASAPLGRLGNADDIAGIGIFLSSRASSYITGAVIPVDGGIATTLSSRWSSDAD
jgi:NAD(P)-dependent dehydrogenase (short-subunit alcohol dehydrogenase family)